MNINQNNQRKEKYMALNEQKGNMYGFVTHTWNTIKGKCYHDCSYCYMKKWGNLKHVRFDEKELNTDLGEGNFIFVGSSCDMWADDIPQMWIEKTLRYCREYNKNTYLFQSKNPGNMIGHDFPTNKILCTTIESDKVYPEIMKNSPDPIERIKGIEWMVIMGYTIHITIEPILDFDLESMIRMIKPLKPEQVNIGADSGNNGLPEPPKEKVVELIYALQKFTKVVKKENLNRLLK